MTNEMKIASIYAKFSGDATPTAEEMYPYLQMAENFGSAAATAKIIEDGTLGDTLFGNALSNADKVSTVFNALFGRDPLQAGLDYWVDQLENNSAYVNETSMAQAILRGAEANADQTDWTNVQGYSADLAADLAAYVPTTGPVEEDGETYVLTSGTDKGADFTGTDNKDTFDASIVQNAFTGGVSNSLSSADKLDGGAGTDSLHAEIVPEFYGSTGDNTAIDITPHTTDIENITFDAMDNAYTEGEVITVDAKYMTGVDSIGSKMSDGDLVIENLTTLTDAGDKRNTSDMTITMDHTDNMNSDEDASDLTVLFDEDYLLTGETTSGASLTIRLLNAVQNESGNNPVEGFSEITFNVGTTEVAVDITSVSQDGTQDFTTAYAAIVNLINAKLDELGFDNVTASAPALEDAVFSIPVAGFTTGDDAGDYYPIIVQNSGPEVLSGVDIATSALQYDTDLNNSFSTQAPETNNNPVSVNVELEKVGRNAEGGNLIIGGKSNDAYGDTDVDQVDGISQFDITVKGDETKPSNLGYIISTNGSLDTVNISSEIRTDNSYAALTVRGENGSTPDQDAPVAPFGGTLDTLNANAFKGDLYIGQEQVAMDIDTFTATGGGDVTLYESIATSGPLASLDANVYTVTTGTGSDTISIDANGGAQVTISTGAGDDTIGISIDGADDSGSTLTKAFITSTSGDNTVITTSSDSAHEAAITLGGGADTVAGNSVNITANTGAGNDAIYTNNTATKAIIVNDVADNAIAGATAITSTTGAGATPDQSELLYGRSVVVTLATEGILADENLQGFESIAVDIEASNGYLTTTTDLHNAIAKAINEDPTLSKLASATVDSNGTLTVSYLVDGDIVVAPTGTEAIEYTISGDWVDLSTTDRGNILSQLEEQYKDSDLVSGSLATAYNTANITTAQAILDNGAGQDGVDSTDGDDNVVNAGLGDDVIVLSSDDNATDTIEIDANGFGNDVVVHFEEGANGDVIDFAHLNNVTSLSGSTVSQIDVAGTVVAATAVNANTVVQVALTDLTDNDAGATTAMAYASLTNSGVLAEINAAADFGVGALPADLVGSKVNSIFMVENDANAGEYKVFEVVYDTGSSQFTEATLAGTVDFGASVTLDDANIA